MAIICSVNFLPNLFAENAVNGNAIKTPIPGAEPIKPTCDAVKLNSCVINLNPPEINTASKPKTKEPIATIIAYKKAFFVNLFILLFFNFDGANGSHFFIIDQ